jgi:3-oxoacyl-[acyl-carrier-protein] synthase II
MVTYRPVSTRVAISGIGVVTPFGTGAQAFADALASGRGAIAALSAFDVSACAARCAASVTGFDPSRWIPPLKLRRMDTTSQYAIAAARQALDASGLDYGEEVDDQVGVVVGTYTAGGSPTEDYLRGLFTQGPIGVPALIFNATVANVAASLVALELKFRGPNVTISQKEASGLLAVAQAMDLLGAGQARALVVAGVDALYPLFFKVHDRFRVLSHDNGAPEGSRPFDITRNGFVLGEGAYALVLEPYELAQARGRVLGEVLAVACGGTSPGINQWPASEAPIARVMRQAIASSGLRPDAVDVVYASANSTPQLDAVEARAIAGVFTAHRPVVTSLKGAIGECSAAGVAGLVAAIMCPASGRVPPVVGLRESDAACDGLVLAKAPAPVPGPVALVNSVASGGALATAVVRASA